MLQILPFMLLSYRNMRLDSETKSALKQEFHLIWKRKEYHIAQDLARELYHNFKLHLDDIEVSMVAMLMLSFEKIKIITWKVKIMTTCEQPLVTLLTSWRAVISYISRINRIC